MFVLRFPYTDLHTLNLDWIIEQLNKEGAVLSVNDKHGIVVLTGEDIKRNTTTPETVSQALNSQGTAIQTVRTQIGTSPLPTTAQSLTGAIAENAGEIADIQDNVIGSTALPTTAQTLTGAIAENASDIANQQDLIGTTALPTTAQTLTGAVVEHETDITAINNKLTNGTWQTATVDAVTQFTAPSNGLLYIYISPSDQNIGYWIATISDWRTIRINFNSGFNESVYIPICQGDTIKFSSSTNNISSALVQFRKMY